MDLKLGKLELPCHTISSYLNRFISLHSYCVKPIKNGNESLIKFTHSFGGWFKGSFEKNYRKHNRICLLLITNEHISIAIEINRHWRGNKNLWYGILQIILTTSQVKHYLLLSTKYTTKQKHFIYLFLLKFKMCKTFLWTCCVVWNKLDNGCYKDDWMKKRNS